MSLPKHVRAYNHIMKACKEDVDELMACYKSKISNHKTRKVLQKEMRELSRKFPRSMRYYFEKTDYYRDFEEVKKVIHGEGWLLFELPHKSQVFLFESEKEDDFGLKDHPITMFYAEQVGVGRITLMVLSTDCDMTAVVMPRTVITRSNDGRTAEGVHAKVTLSDEMENWAYTWLCYLLFLLNRDRVVEDVERFYDVSRGEENVTNIFKTVRIHTEKPRVRYMDPSQDTGRHNRYHGVRGHYVHYSKPIKSGPNQGKTRVFRVAHNRGDLSLGRVYKDYEVEK